MKNNGPKYSLIVTCHYEEKSIHEFHQRVSAVLQQLGESYEIIMVNDGSTDGTFTALAALFDQDPTVTHIIDLTRNFGQGAAFTAGLSYASGERVVYMDSDLQLDPEDLPKLVEAYAAGSDMVKGRRMHRNDPLMRRVLSWCANQISRRPLNDRIQDIGCTYLLFARSIADQMEYGPWHRWKKMEFLLQSNRVQEVPVRHHARKYGKSGQPFGRLWGMNMDHLIQLSDKPFQYLGLFALLLSGLLLLRIIVGFLFGGRILEAVSNGLLLNVIAMTFLFNLGVLCLVGEFCIRSFMQGGRKPHYIIRTIRSRTQEVA